MFLYGFRSKIRRIYFLEGPSAAKEGPSTVIKVEMIALALADNGSGSVGSTIGIWFDCVDVITFVYDGVRFVSVNFKGNFLRVELLL